MIKFYARCSKKERAFRKKLRNQIIKIGAIIGIDKYDFHSKIIYQIVYYCPSVLTSLYPIYRSIKNIVYELQ